MKTLRSDMFPTSAVEYGVKCTQTDLKLVSNKLSLIITSFIKFLDFINIKIIQLCAAIFYAFMVSISSFFVSVFIVVLTRTQKQMVWIYASSIITGMQNTFISCVTAMMNQPRYSMGQLYFAIKSKCTISVRFPSRPFPAGMKWDKFHIIKEFFNVRHIALLIFLFFMTTGCGSIRVYDKEVCGDLGAFGAHCAHTLVNKTRDLTEKQWDMERVGWLCTDSTGFNDTETTIDQVCLLVKCDYQTRQSLTKAFNRVRRVAHRAIKAQETYRAELLLQGIDLDYIPQ